MLNDPHLMNGNYLKPKQIETLIKNDFHNIAAAFEINLIQAKKHLPNYMSCHTSFNMRAFID